MIYSELKIVSSNDLTKRAYVTFYFKGTRIREYNGNNVDMSIKPNTAKSVKERDKLLKKLEFELQKALENNSYPVSKDIQIEEAETKIKTTFDLLSEAINKKTSSDLSKFY